jgi:hypothetical protein
LRPRPFLFGLGKSLGVRVFSDIGSSTLVEERFAPLVVAILGGDTGQLIGFNITDGE